MRYAAINGNDLINGEGVCVSFWTQGCPHRCPGCHNPELWSFDGGIWEHEVSKVFQEINEKMTANGIERNFSILGGEPLCDENISTTIAVAAYVRAHFPKAKIFLWTGYVIDTETTNIDLRILFDLIDVIIDGPYEEDKRDVTLKLRGSSNQRVLYKGVDF